MLVYTINIASIAERIASNIINLKIGLKIPDYIAILTNLKKSGDIDKLLEWLDHCKNNSRPNRDVYLICINALIDHRNFSQSLLLHAEMVSNLPGTKNRPEAKCLLMRIHGLSNDLEAALKDYNDHLDQLHLSDGSNSLYVNTIMECLIANGKYNEAMDIFKNDFKRLNLHPNRDTFNLVFIILEKWDNLDLAIEYWTLINRHARLLDVSLHPFESKVPSKFLQPHAFGEFYLYWHNIRHRDLDFALKITEKGFVIPKAGILGSTNKPLSSTYESMLSILLSSLNGKSQSEISRIIKGMHVLFVEMTYYNVPTHRAYEIFIKALLISGDEKAAVDWFDGTLHHRMNLLDTQLLTVLEDVVSRAEEYDGSKIGRYAAKNVVKIRGRRSNKSEDIEEDQGFGFAGLEDEEYLGDEYVDNEDDDF